GDGWVVRALGAEPVSRGVSRRQEARIQPRDVRAVGIPQKQRRKLLPLGVEHDLLGARVTSQPLAGPLKHVVAGSGAVMSEHGVKIPRGEKDGHASDDPSTPRRPTPLPDPVSPARTCTAAMEGASNEAHMRRAKRAQYSTNRLLASAHAQSTLLMTNSHVPTQGISRSTSRRVSAAMNTTMPIAHTTSINMFV